MQQSHMGASHEKVGVERRGGGGGGGGGGGASRSHTTETNETYGQMGAWGMSYAGKYAPSNLREALRCGYEP